MLQYNKLLVEDPVLFEEDSRCCDWTSPMEDWNKRFGKKGAVPSKLAGNKSVGSSAEHVYYFSTRIFNDKTCSSTGTQQTQTYFSKTSKNDGPPVFVATREGDA